MLFTVAAVFALNQGTLLDSEPRLSKVVSVRAEAETVQSVVERIGAEAGLQLEVAPTIANDLIVMYMRPAPAREGLQKLAGHFSWSWEKTKDGYRLARTAAQQIEEERQAQRSLVEMYRPWRDRAIEALKSDSKPTDMDDYDAALAEQRDLLSRYDAEYYGPDPQIRQKWIDASQAVERKRLSLARRISPVWSIHDTIVASMSDADILALDATTKLVYSTAPTAWQRPMPAGLAATISRSITLLSRESVNTHSTDDTRFYRQRDLLTNTRKPFQAGDVSFVRVVFKQDSRFDPGSRAFPPSVILTVHGKDGSFLAMINADERQRYTNETPAKPKAPKDALDDPLAPTSEIENLNKTGSPRVVGLRVTDEAFAQFLEPKSRVHPARGFAKLLIGIAEASNIDLISDVYDRQGWLYTIPVPTGTPRQAFEAAATRLSSSYSFDGRWVSMRANHWQAAREATLPLPALFKIRDRLAPDPFDFTAAAESTLLITDRQAGAAILRHLLNRQAQWNINERDGKPLYLLRFWGALDAGTRERLLSGQMVPFSSLNAQQASFLNAFAYRVQERLYQTAIFPRSLGGIEDADLEWLLQAWPGFGPSSGDEDWLDRDLESTQRLPNGIPGNALIGVRHSQGNALILSNGKGWNGRMTEQSALIGGYYKPDTDEFLVIPTKEDRYFFTILPAPRFGMGHQFGAIRTPKEGQPKKYSELPEDIRKRLEKAAASRNGG